jgi:hypothetical protein
MNPAFPPNPPRPSAEKRFRGLIISAQVLSILVFIGVVLTLGWTAQQKGKRMAEELEESMRSMQEDIAVADMDSGSDDYDIESQEASNDIQYELIEINTPDTTNNRYDVISALEYLRSQSDEMCEKIRDLKTRFNDTLYYASDDYETSENFFIKAGRAKLLKTQLYVYRENIVSRLSEISPNSEYSLREAMPLDDTPSSDYVTAWDEDEFSYSPSTVKQYLHDLELQVRTFESTAQNKFPQTVSDPSSY